jgi:hypothetical protein
MHQTTSQPSKRWQDSWGLDVPIGIRSRDTSGMSPVSPLLDLTNNSGHRCMEHSVDLSANHFVQAVAPSSAQKVLKKIRSAFEGININNDLDLDGLDARLVECDLDEGDDDDDNEVSSEEFDMGDSLDKALALVKQV